ncbi:SOS response-associated peptidase [Paenibacillus allorhizosphaerae]|uniref:Abasic site processing protein n=1 Tax=Paenibacillus allorhizosphaerae TaxID=2849866 RepID=A0ABM8VNP6_9BACL|nr:SOS response-associated peptidase [Paenibacillus allorhizosphaerae]CAG7651795.1 SOS response-associated protein YedK [Paenibacillus allorhizosphaerae]
MCGRFSLSVEENVIRDEYQFIGSMESYKARFNIAPTSNVWVITNNGVTNEIRKMRWGLIPFWSKDSKSGYTTFNARAETLISKPAFREPFKRSRALILSNGFFEWQVQEDSKQKQPMRIVVKDRQVFGFAGLYDVWRNSDGNEVTSCSIITIEPNQLMEKIHNRMPVILPKENEEAWLEPKTTDTDFLKTLLTPYSSKEMEAYPVSNIVGNVKNDIPECLERII